MRIHNSDHELTPLLHLSTKILLSTLKKPAAAPKYQVLMTDLPSGLFKLDVSSI